MKEKKVRYDIQIPMSLVEKAESLKPNLSAFVTFCLRDDKLIEKFYKSGR